jgi:hypothetical protein
MDDNNELIIYVLQQLRYGVSEQAVRATLAQTGWPQPLIDRAFSMVQQAAPHQMPPTDYSAAQAAYTQPAASLPSPAEPTSALPAPEEPQMQFPSTRKETKKRKRLVRPLIITLIVIALLGALGFGLYKAMRHDPASKPQVTTAQADATRKQAVDKLATELQAYYNKYHSYPTLNDINSLTFSSAKNAFDESKTHDPTWNAKKSTCVDSQGRAQLTDTRSSDCFSYRVTAMNGSDCDESAKPCTRVVLTANLSNNKPYIVALDQNIKE